MCVRRWWTALVLFLVVSSATPGQAQFVADPEKTDSLRLRNGDWVVGDIREMTRGIVTYKTDAMSTVSVKWTRVLTASTDKRFQIYLADERRYFGSLQASDTFGRLVIRADRDTFEVATQSVVELQRIKSSFWNRLDGSIDFGFNFTQQNAKTDMSLRADLKYLVAANRFGLTLDGTFSRQDSVSSITRGTARVTFIRELQGLWFVGFFSAAEQNSQLSLDVRGSIGAGPGRFFLATNRIVLGSMLGLAYNREKFTGEDASNAVPLGLITDFQFFNWSGLSTDLSSRLSILSVVDDWGRWRASFTANLSQEIVSQLYLRIGISELYDSRPPSADANKNDFAVTTSLGFTF